MTQFTFSLSDSAQLQLSRSRTPLPCSCVQAGLSLPLVSRDPLPDDWINDFASASFLEGTQWAASADAWGGLSAEVSLHAHGVCTWV